jgi:hypothetical protein
VVVTVRVVVTVGTAVELVVGVLVAGAMLRSTVPGVPPAHVKDTV